MKIYQYILSALCAVVVTSCSKDLGNYDYAEIGEINISGVNDKYVVRSGIDTLRIQPKFAFSEEVSDTSAYSYIWILRSDAKTVDTIGADRDLVYPVRLIPQDYNLYYRVKDKKNGVEWAANSTVTVSTASSRGFLIIGEDEQGYAEAEMLAMVGDTVHIKNILSGSGLPRLREPLSFLHTGGDERERKLWVFTGTGSYFLDRASLSGSESNDFRKLLYVSEPLNPEGLNPVAMAPQIRTASGLVGSSFYRAMVTKNGDVFAMSPFIMNGDFYNNPVNRVADDPTVKFPAAPYLLFPIGSFSSFVWYDTQNNRFLSFNNFARNVSNVLKDDAGSKFPWNQPEGRTLVYAENTRNTDGGSRNGNSFAIMKDADNSHHIYSFLANGANPTKVGYFQVNMSIATDFDKADFYAFSSKRSVIFYSVGNRLYAYDYNPSNQKLYSSFPGLRNDEITMIKFDTQLDHLTNSLYIATYNSSTKGTLRRFNVGTNPNLVDLTLQENSIWTNLVKVKNINWRAIN